MIGKTRRISGSLRAQLVNGGTFLPFNFDFQEKLGFKAGLGKNVYLKECIR